uniref:Helix-turn-helix domain-containing protein n=1 Tax=Oncorhynchus tshawytscha TaxID=74940 RepID=A0AAZ3PPL7_ONCTS
MPRVPAHMRERTLGMLQGDMRTADVARAINCNVRTVRRLRQRYRETGRTADCPRSGRPHLTTPAQDRYIRTSHLRDRYRMAATKTARVTAGIHHPSISAQNVRNRLREAGLRACRPVVKAGPHQISPATTLPIGTSPPSLDQTGLAKSALHWRVAVLSNQG